VQDAVGRLRFLAQTPEEGEVAVHLVGVPRARDASSVGPGPRGVRKPDPLGIRKGGPGAPCGAIVRGDEAVETALPQAPRHSRSESAPFLS